MVRLAKMLRASSNVELLVLQCLRTGFGQRLGRGLQTYSHGAIPIQKFYEESKIRLTEPVQPRGRPVTRTPISTLNQDRLLPSDYLDVSNCSRPTIKFRDEIDDECEPTWQVCYRELRGDRLPFPPRSSGFLYYHQPQGAPQLAGELRFRLTPSIFPNSFSQGEDCLTPEGDVWKIPLLALHYYPYHQHLYRQLRLDGFVSDVLHSKLKKVATTCVCPRNTSVVLHSLHQVFPINFAARSFRFFVVGDSTCRMVDIRFPFEMHVQGYKKGSPYTSKGLVRFELSGLPEHAGTRTVVMRVVKLLGDEGPYLGEDRPLEGALVLRHHSAGQPKLFCLDVDRDSPNFGRKNFSHPDALPLLLANTFGDKHPRP